MTVTLILFVLSAFYSLISTFLYSITFFCTLSLILRTFPLHRLYFTCFRLAFLIFIYELISIILPIHFFSLVTSSAPISAALEFVSVLVVTPSFVADSIFIYLHYLLLSSVPSLFCSSPSHLPTYIPVISLICLLTAVTTVLSSFHTLVFF